MIPAAPGQDIRHVDEHMRTEEEDGSRQSDRADAFGEVRVSPSDLIYQQQTQTQDERGGREGVRRRGGKKDRTRRERGVE